MMFRCKKPSRVLDFLSSSSRQDDCNEQDLEDFLRIEAAEKQLDDIIATEITHSQRAIQANSNYEQLQIYVNNQSFRQADQLESIYIEPRQQTPRFLNGQPQKLSLCQKAKFLRKGKQTPDKQNQVIVARAKSPLKPRECDQQSQSQLIEKHLRNKIKFTDQIFPPSVSSIFTKPVILPGKEPVIEWQRARRLYQWQPLLAKYVDPSDIMPGLLSSPKMLSALAIMAEKPDLVFGALQQQDVNSEGIYMVRVRPAGIVRYIHVDDFLPFKKQQKRAKPARKEVLVTSSYGGQAGFQFWPFLLEKVVAKTVASYENIHLAQRITDILDLLVVSVGKPLQFQQEQVLGQLEKGSLVFAQGCKFDFQSLKRQYSYAIIACRDGRVRLRDPGWSNNLTCQLQIKLSTAQQLFQRITVYPLKQHSYYNVASVRHSPRFDCLVSIVGCSQHSFTLYQNKFVPPARSKAKTTLVKQGEQRYRVHCCDGPKQLNFAVGSAGPVEIVRHQLEPTKCQSCRERNVR